MAHFIRAGTVLHKVCGVNKH